jgi:hypothetical protein
MANVHLNLNRTFREKSASSSDDDSFEGGWSDIFNRKAGGLTWASVLKNKVAVVLGEAGMGKTVEFQDQVERLRADGKYAFLMALNKITTAESFELEVSGIDQTFEEWKCSTQNCFIFLDAVDEAHLKGITSLTQTLAIISKGLVKFSARCSFIISSRISDWQIPEVREAIDRYLLSLVNKESNAPDHVQEDENDHHEENQRQTKCKTKVFKLQPLSHQDVMLLAEANGATPVADFWRAIEDGDFEYMATRPRDLEWMTRRWAKSKTLGTFLDLLEDAVTNRLKEHNLCYTDEGDNLSADELREGSERLAAANVFCNRPFISYSDSTEESNEISPSDVLSKWNSKTQQRVLGTSIFDEATYGRVQFHHRSYREFLAAHWLSRLLKDGLPIDEALKLFGGGPYGVPVLINWTRATLCWLAALNIEIREHVIKEFPEMVMYEGDPEVWDTDQVVAAFTGYVEKLESGFQPNWWNGIGEIRRIARKLPSTVVLQYLNKYPNSYKVTSRLLAFVRHAKIRECADATFNIYRDSSVRPTLRRIALATLGAVAEEKHKTEIKNDLLSKVMGSNSFIAEALCIVDFNQLSLDELTDIFDHAEEEGEYGGGEIQNTITDELLPNLELQSAQTLLVAMYNSVANNDDLKSGQPIYEFSPKNVWKLYSLVPCLTRVVQLAKKTVNIFDDRFSEIILFVGHLRHTRFVNKDKFEELRQAINKDTALKEKIALIVGTVGYSKNMSIVELVIGSGLVTFQLEDLEGIAALAVQHGFKDNESEIWFQVAIYLAFIGVVSHDRREGIIQELCSVKGKVAKHRQKLIRQKRKEIEAALQQKEDWDNQEAARKSVAATQMADLKSAVFAVIDKIRNATHFEAIQRLVTFSNDCSSRSRYTHVSIDIVAATFGADVARALSEGLNLFWRIQSPPIVINVPNTKIPMTGLIGLASVNFSMNDELTLSGLSDSDLMSAVQYCLWDLDEPEQWYKSVCSVRPAPIVSALEPWFVHELKHCTDLNNGLRTFDFVLYRNSGTVKLTLLNLAKQMLIRNEIPLDSLQLRIAREAIELGLINSAEIAQLAQQKLSCPQEIISSERKMQWLGEFLVVDFNKGWAWVRSHRKICSDSPSDVAICLASSLGGKNWMRQFNGTQLDLKVLAEVFNYISPFVNIQIKDLSQSDHSFQHPVNMLRDSIARTIVSRFGMDAHSALVGLLETVKSNYVEIDWIKRLILEHSISESERQANYSVSDLMNFGEFYCRMPKTGNELFEQVNARLNQIKKNIEFGTFSERIFFNKGMPEEDLQLWLAARLNDSPRRNFSTRFSVQRETVVDKKKRTDIEVSSSGFKLCIEIKPVDTKRTYTVTSLVDTLQTQIVDQYLRLGQNSRHGLLVLFRLDKKKWVIHKGKKAGTFADLVDFLQIEADRIRANNSWCERLTVIGVDTTGSE